MIDRSEAEEHLRVIRSLMEKATIYRAISAEAALVGGICALGLAARAGNGGTMPPFLVGWLSVLAVTSTVNFVLLWRDAKRRGDPFFSSGMRVALRAMLPAMITGGMVIFLETEGGYMVTASLWVLLYGVSLLATSHFAPKAICWLGRAFFLGGIVLLLDGALITDWWRGRDQEVGAHIFMGIFGLFHLIYAACTWPRRAR